MAIIVVGFLFLMAPMANAAVGVPKIISHQGRLLDSSEALLGGSGTPYCFRFSLYTDPNPGAPDTKLWPAGTPSTMTVNVKNGVYNVGIGDTSAGGDPLTFDFQSTDTVYLNIEVAAKVGATCAPGDGAESFETLSPRQPVWAAGYAINSDTVDGFHAAQSASGSQVTALTNGNLILGASNPQINVTGSNTLTLQNAGVGDVQFFSNSNKLTSAGNLTIAGSATAKGLISLGAATDLSSGPNEDLTLDANGTGSLVFTGYDCSLNANGGKLTTDATGKVVCADDISGGGGGSSAWSDLTNPTGNLSLAMGADTSTFTFGASTGTNPLFKYIDSPNNTGTGPIMDIETATNSSAVPLRVVTNGVAVIDTTASGGLAINSSTWDVSAAGVGSGFTGFTTTGNVTLSGATVTGAAPLVFDGATANANKTTLAVADPTSSHTITLPDASGTVAVSANGPITLSAAGAIGCATCVTNGSALFTTAGNSGSATLSQGGTVTVRGDGTILTTTDSATDTISIALDQTKLDLNQIGGGPLAINKGGTNNTSFTTNRLVTFNGTSLVSSAIDPSTVITTTNIGSNAVTSVTAGSGLTGGGGPGAVTLNVVGGPGISVLADEVDVDSTTTGVTASVGSNSGIETTSGGIRLLGGCSNSQILKWNAGSSQWECSSDATGGALTVRQTDLGAIVTPASVIEYGPTSTSTDEFVVTDQGGGIARVRTGTKVALTNQNETVTGNWVFQGGLNLTAATIAGGAPLVFDGSTVNANKLTLSVADPTAARNITLPDASGTVAVSGSGPITLSAAGTIGCATCVTTGSGLFTSAGNSGSGTVSQGGTLTVRGDGTIVTTTDSATNTISIALDQTKLDLNQIGGGPLAINKGGTNNTSFTTNRLLTFNGTSLVSSSLDPSTVLTNGSNLFTTAGNSGSATLAQGGTLTVRGDGTIVATTDSGTNTISIALDQTKLDLNQIGGGPLSIAKGGTNASSFTPNTLTFFNGTSLASTSIDPSSVLTTGTGLFTTAGNSGSATLNQGGTLTVRGDGVVLATADSGTNTISIALDQSQIDINGLGGSALAISKGGTNNTSFTPNTLTFFDGTSLSSTSIDPADVVTTGSNLFTTAGNTGSATLAQGGTLTVRGDGAVLATTDSGTNTITIALDQSQLDLNQIGGGPLAINKGGTNNTAFNPNTLTFFDGTSLASTSINPADVLVTGSGLFSTAGNTGGGTLNQGDTLTVRGDGVVIATTGSSTNTISIALDQSQIDINALGGGPLAINKGGTNASSFTSSRLISFNGTSLVSSSIDPANVMTNGSNLFAFAGSAGSPSTIAQNGTATIIAGTNTATTGNGAGGVTVSVVNNPTFSGLVTANGGLTASGTMNLTAATLSGASPLVFEGATIDANKTTFAITDPTASRTVTFPDASGTVAVNAVGPITLSATGTIACATCVVNGGPIFTSAGNSGSSSIVQGSTLNIVGGTDISTTDNGLRTLTINDSSTLASVTGRGATTTTNSAFNGGASVRGLVVDSATATNDRILTTAANVGAARFDGTITNADLTAARTWTLPDTTGTFAVAATGPITLSAAGVIGCATCVTSIGSTSLQAAYNSGNSITTGTSTPIAFNLASGGFNVTGAGAVNLTPTAASQFTSGGALTFTGGAASTWSTSAGALTVDSAAALNLGTTNATSVSVSKAGATTTVNGALTVAQNANLNGDTTIGDAATDGLTVTSEIRGASPLVFEGATNDNVYTTFNITDPTVARSITFPNASGTVAVSATGPITLSAAGDIGCATCVTSGSALFTTAGNSGSATLNQGGTLTVRGDGVIVATTDSGTNTISIALDQTKLDLNQIGGGPLAINKGGTNASSFTSSRLISFNGTSLVSSSIDPANVMTNGSNLFAFAGSAGSPSTIAQNGTATIIAGTNTATTGNGAGGVTVSVVNNPTFSGLLTANAGLTASGTLNLTSATLSGASPLVFEGATVDANKTTFAVADPTATRTITLPDASGTVAVAAVGPITLSATGTIACASCVVSGGPLFTSAGNSGSSSIVQGSTLNIVGGTDISTTDNGLRTLTINDSSTLASVTGRGASTATNLALTGGAAIRGLVVDSATATNDRILTTAANIGAARFDGTITNADLTAPRSWTLPDASGTFAVAANGPITLSATGTIGCATCLTAGGTLWNLAGTSGSSSSILQGGTAVIAAGSNVSTVGSGTGSVLVAVVNNPTFTGPVTTSGGLTTSGSLNLTGATITGGSPLVFDGATADANKLTLNVTDPTTARTITLPNASGTVAVSASGPITLSAAGDIGCATCVTNGGSLFTLAGSTGSNSLIVQGGTATVAAGTNTLAIGNGAGTVTIGTVNNPTFSGLLTASGGVTASGNLNFTGGNITGGSPLVFDGATADANKTTVTVTDPTAARSIALPDNSGTFAVAATGPITLSAAGVIGCASCVTSVSPTNLQGAYSNSTSSVEIALNAAQGGITVADSAGGIGANLFEVQSAANAKYFSVSATGVTSGVDLAVNGANLTTTQTTFNLLNTIATTINFGGVASTLNIGPGGATATSVNLAGGSGATGCTVDGATGNFTCSGAIATTATTGTQGWWGRAGTTLSPVNAGDNVTTSGTISTSGSGTITSASDVAVLGGNLTTTAATASLFNGGATTINMGGAATTMNIGPSGSLATSINFAGGSGATGCTINGATGNLTCTGNIATTSGLITATGLPISGLLSATGTNTIANTNLAQVWNWGTLTSQTGLTLGGGSAMTTGSVLALNSATFAHSTALESGSLLSLSFTDASTTASASSTTNGINIASSINTSGAGTKNVNALNVSAPTLSACASGSCNWAGLAVATASTSNALVTQTGLDINAIGSTAGTVLGLDISDITGGNAAETAMRIGSGWDKDIVFTDHTPVIELPDVSGTTTPTELRVNDSAGNNLLALRDMGTGNNAFGAAVTSGAFINRDSVYAMEFQINNPSSCTGDTVDARGDFGHPFAACTANSANLSVDETVNGGGSGTCGWTSLADTVNGVERTTATRGSSTSVGCSEFLGTPTANDAQNVFNAANKPLIVAKVRPSVVASTANTFIGIGDITTGITAMPNNGIFFTNCTNAACTTSSPNWQGVVRNAGGTPSIVDCGAPGAISTSQFAFLRAEVRNDNDVHFFVDKDVSDGIVETECGTGNGGTTPSVNMTIMMSAGVETGTNSMNLDVDYIRVFQDDASGSSIPNATPVTQPVNPIADYAASSAFATTYPSASPLESFLPGTLVSIDRTHPEGPFVATTAKPNDPDLVGVVSGAPGMMLDNDNMGGPLVAIGGRARVRVSAENGEISVGDYLTSSSTPGVAMKATKAGTVFGRVLSIEVGPDGAPQVIADISPASTMSVFPRTADGADRETMDDTILASLNTQTAVDQATTELRVDRAVAGLSVIAPKGVFEGLSVDSIGSLHDAVSFASKTLFIGRPYFNNDMGGYAVIREGDTAVEVDFQDPYEIQPVVDASFAFEDDADGVSSDTAQQLVFADDIRFVIAKKTTSGFQIRLNKAAPVNLRFNWTALAVKDPRTATSDGSVTSPAPLSSDTGTGSTPPPPSGHHTTPPPPDTSSDTGSTGDASSTDSTSSGSSSGSSAGSSGSASSGDTTSTPADDTTSTPADDTTPPPADDTSSTPPADDTTVTPPATDSGSSTDTSTSGDTTTSDAPPAAPTETADAPPAPAADTPAVTPPPSDAGTSGGSSSGDTVSPNKHETP